MNTTISQSLTTLNPCRQKEENDLKKYVATNQRQRHNAEWPAKVARHKLLAETIWKISRKSPYLTLEGKTANKYTDKNKVIFPNVE